MNTVNRIRIRAILKIILLYTTIQLACIVYIAKNTGIFSLFFVGFSVITHGILFTYLVVRRGDFRSLTTNQPFTHMNIANCLTTFRISSTPTFCYCCIVVFQTQRFAVFLVLFAALSTLTDFLDGILSRRLNQMSPLGKHLDSMADYFLLISVTATYVYIQFLPLYYVLIIAVRYLLQAGIAIYLYFFKSTYTTGATTLGKTTVFVLMLFLNFQLLRFFPWFTGILHIINTALLWSSTGLMCISFIERSYLFIQDIRRAKTKKHPIHNLS